MVYYESRKEPSFTPTSLEFYTSNEKSCDRGPIDIEDHLADFFDQQVDGLYKNLQEIRHPASPDHAEAALEQLYIAVSIVDSKLSQEGREHLKNIMVDEARAFEILVQALKRKYPNPAFYRRACACLAYWIRDSPERATTLLEIGGCECIFDMMRDFPCHEVILWYGLDLLGLLASCADMSDRELETLSIQVVDILIDLFLNSQRVYAKACQAFVAALKTKEIRTKVSRHISQISQEFLAFHQQQQQQQADTSFRDEEKSSNLESMEPILVCHDLLQLILDE